MTCPACGAGAVSVLKSMDSGTFMARRRACACGARWTTEERLVKGTLVATGGQGGAPPDQGPPPTASKPPPVATPGYGGVGGGLPSDPNPIPDPNPVLADLPIRAREPAAARIWTPDDWKRRFGIAWSTTFTKGARFYGGAGDSKACGALDDLIRDLPEADVLAAQERAGEMFAEFFADRSKAVSDARHSFAFFVGRWGGLRVPKAAELAPDPRCDWHREPANTNRPSKFPRAGCPRCKHFTARGAGRVSEPASTAEVLAIQERFQREKEADQQRKEATP